MADSARLGTPPKPGSFLHIERQIRKGGASGAAAAAQGRQFEDLCVHFLSVAPEYRGTFKRIWRWRDWPSNWGADKGIDLVALTKEGKYWAIQAKAFDPAHSIKKEEIDSFLSESSRPEFAYRLLIATTDRIGANAREVIKGQEKPVGQRLRTDLLQAELVWPTEVGGSAKPLPPKNPREDQKQAIADALRGFDQYERGQLIMACGSGKTLTALWIAERLDAKLVLLLVPSLSLVGQTLAEWRRSSKESFRYLVVCSDETVVRGEDITVHSTRDLGVPVTTDVGDVRRFINDSHRSAANYVFCTYQSSPVVAEALAKANQPFDLVIADEAHRCAGAKETAFGTVLNEKRIKAKRRLFMTATPRYFTGRVKKRAAELEYEIASMDDKSLFGPVFHKLTFNAAIRAGLLTDYQVVVIGVSDTEKGLWAEEGRLVRTRGGATTDARTLASQIGLAKATRKYDLRRVITFHSSIKKASLFTNAANPESYPAIIQRMGRHKRPSGEIWATHISGEMPAGRRRTLLEELRNLDQNTRGVISNCACLGEGVDVPTLDGIAFIDPKRSMVDIIQAVGRVIRKDPSGKKKIGTIVIPVFVDESADAEKAMSSSAFEPVWQVLRALRAHDQALADEMDSIRTKLGRQVAPGRKVHLPAKISIDIPELVFKNFEHAFYARTIERTTALPPLTVDQILKWADEHHRRTDSWPMAGSGEVKGAIGETWGNINIYLARGQRGLPGGSSLAKLLFAQRGHRTWATAPDLNVERILELADDHHKRTGNWPQADSGDVGDGSGETWSAVNASLSRGLRGLPGGSSLAQLLAEQRGVRNKKGLPSLQVNQILKWADEYHRRKSSWPKARSGTVQGVPGETWSSINSALTVGLRGLPGGSSLPRLLAEFRGVRNEKDPPRLTTKQILTWADKHRQRTGVWPAVLSGGVHGAPGESWQAINMTLTTGGRGLKGGSSLAKLLAKKRGHRTSATAPSLTLDRILALAEGHFKKVGKWPKRNSSPILGMPGDSWQTIDHALRKGIRGLPSEGGLAQFLFKRKGVIHHLMRERLTMKQVLKWADEHFQRTNTWPIASSGAIASTHGETWRKVDQALRRGIGGLPGGSSLAKLLLKSRGVKHQFARDELTVEKILKWADVYYRQRGSWPKQASGAVIGVRGESWGNISAALALGRRGLPGGSSLARLLAQERGVRNEKELPKLTIKRILALADEHHRRTGKWPTQTPKVIPESGGENWKAISLALYRGSRGLPAGSSLAKLLAQERGVRNEKQLSKLTIKRILALVDKHHRRTGKWPTRKSGAIPDSGGESWMGIDHALFRGSRGLPGGSSLAKLLAREHGARRK